jgi:acetoin utilization protein AcuB
MIAKQLITDSVVPLKPTDTGTFALAQMDECRLSHLPILGLISDREILALHEPDMEVGTYKLPVVLANIGEDQHIYEVIKAFDTLGVTVLPVVDAKNQYLGTITLSTVVKSMAGIAAIQNPGGVIVLEISSKDYSISEIAQIVESNDAKILSLYITSHPDSSKLEVTVKVNRIEIGTLLQTFYRYNYLVKASWSHEDAYSAGLQDRFDALMNYLSI